MIDNILYKKEQKSSKNTLKTTHFIRLEEIQYSGIQTIQKKNQTFQSFYLHKYRVKQLKITF